MESWCRGGKRKDLKIGEQLVRSRSTDLDLLRVGLV